jgi:hypothetical protein
VELRHPLKAEHHAKPALASADHKVFELTLIVERAQLVNDDPDLFVSAAKIRGQQLANETVGPHVLQRERRRARILGRSQEEPTAPASRPFDRAPPGMSRCVGRQVAERIGGVGRHSDDAGTLVVRTRIDQRFRRRSGQRLLEPVARQRQQLGDSLRDSWLGSL